MTIHDINCKYLAYFDPLYRAEGKRPEKLFKLMSDNLIMLYEQEVEDFLDDRMLAYSMQRFERKYKVSMYTPRRGFLWRWNRTAKQLLKRYRADFEVFLAELDKERKEAKDYASELKQEVASPHPSSVPALPEGKTTLPVPSETDVAPK